MIDLNTVLFRLGLAFVFGAIIGIEREWRHKNAGLKTNTFVALGAAAFAMVSNTFGQTNHNPAQIAAAVVTGIGFIGAGVIIHRGEMLQGVTTAATLWAEAATGLCIGLGQYGVGVTLFVMIVFVQFSFRPAERWLAARHRAASRMELRIDSERSALATVNHLWKEFTGTTRVLQLRRVISPSGVRIIFIAPAKRPVDLTPLEEKLAAVSGVHHIDVRFLGTIEDPHDDLV